MDKELFRKTEGKLYRYYKGKNKIRRLKNELIFLESKKNRLESDIKNTNITIDYYQSGAGLSERVQTSATGSSYAEQEMIREISKLEREHISTIKKILKTKKDIEDLEEFINHMKENIEQLDEEDKRFIEYKYGDGKSLLYIATELCISKTTAYRKREELVNNVGEWDNFKMWNENGKNVKKTLMFNRL